MFTGLITATGRIDSATPSVTPAAGAADTAYAGMRLSVSAGELGLEDVAVGDSIAINGVCLTVVEKTEDTFAVDVSRETLACTTGLDGTGRVNLEKAMRLGDRIGGHLVSGHVDGTGEVVQFRAVGESWLLVVQAAREIAKYFAFKGSVAINGVSLTVNRVEDVAAGVEFSINVIPHTFSNTTLGQLCVGARVNLEVDQIARYVERVLSVGDAARGDR